MKQKSPRFGAFLFFNGMLTKGFRLHSPPLGWFPACTVQLSIDGKQPEMWLPFRVIQYDRSGRQYTWTDPESGLILSAPAKQKGELFRAAVSMLDPELYAAATKTMKISVRYVTVFTIIPRAVG